MNNFLFRQSRPYCYFVYFDYSIVVLALLANCFVMSAIVRCAAFSKQTFYRHFLISLIASDLYITFVNIATLFYQIADALSFDTNATKPAFFKCGANVLRTLRLAGFFANLLSLCGMSLNHFFGVVYPVKYHCLAHKKVTRLSVFAVWFVSFFLAFLDIPINVILYENISSKFPNISREVPDTALATWDDSPMPSPSPLADEEAFDSEAALPTAISATTLPPHNVVQSLEQMFDKLAEEENARQILYHDPCTFYSESKMWFEFCVIILSFTSTILLSVCYGIIIKMISKNVATLGRTARKTIFTTVMLIVAYASCWLPFMAFEFVMLILFQSTSGPTTQQQDLLMDDEKAQPNDNSIARIFLIQNALNSCLMLYPLLDACIYSARIPAVTQNILQKLSCACCPKRLLSGRNQQSSSSNYYCNNNTIELGNANNALLEMTATA